MLQLQDADSLVAWQKRHKTNSLCSCHPLSVTGGGGEFVAPGKQHPGGARLRASTRNAL